MARRIGPGGPFLVTQLAPDAALSCEDAEGDAWWSGPNRNGIAPFLLAAAASLATNVAIANSFSNQEEWAKPVSSGGYESVSFRAIGTDAIPPIYWADEDLPFTAPVEEYDWQPFSALKVPIQWVQYLDEGELPRIAEDEYEWRPAVRLPGPVWIGPQETDEWVPAPTTIADEYEWNLLTFAQPPPKPQPSSHADEGVGLYGAADELYWQAPGVIAAQPKITLWALEDDLPPQTTTQIDDEYWFNPAYDPVVIQLVYWPERGAAGATPLASAPPDEEYRFELKRGPIDPIRGPHIADDEPIVTAATPIAFEEDWVTFRPKIVGLYPEPIRADEEIPTAVYPTEGSPGAGSLRAHIKPLHLRWYVQEELPVFVAPQVTEDDVWVVFAPLPVPPKFAYIPDGAEDPAGNLFSQPEEYYWQPAKIQPPTFVAPFWQVDDEWVPPPPPLAIDESEWNVYTPTWLKPNPLYLPDQEELQADGLIPVEVVTPIDGHFPPAPGGLKPRPIKGKPALKPKVKIAHPAPTGTDLPATPAPAVRTEPSVVAPEGSGAQAAADLTKEFDATPEELEAFEVAIALMLIIASEDDEA